MTNENLEKVSVLNQTYWVPWAGFGFISYLSDRIRASVPLVNVLNWYEYSPLINNNFDLKLIRIPSVVYHSTGSNTGFSYQMPKTFFYISLSKS